MYKHLIWSRSLLSVFVLTMGLTNIASALLVHDVMRNHLLHALLPMDVVQTSRSITLVAGFGLLLVARALWRGKRVAWLLTLGLLLLSAVFHLVKGLDWEESVGALLLSGVLVADRQQFTRRSDPPTLRRVPLFVAGGLLAISGYALAGFWFLRAFRPFAPLLALQELVAELFWNEGPYATIVAGRAAWFLDSISLLGALLVLSTLWLLLRPVLARPGTAAERERAHALVRRYGSSSLAPFALGDDKLWYFGEAVEGLVAYRTAGGVAVVCGDPIAAPQHVGALAQEFVAFCNQQDWQACFYEVQPDLFDQYAALGFEAIKIGEDAWIDLPTFTLKGSAISDIRHAVSKVMRDGIGFQLLDAVHEEQLWAQMQTIEAGWRAAQNGIELRFSIGHLPAQPDPTARYTVALAADGTTVLAYCSFLAIGGIDGLALDVMRRAPSAPNGTMEFLLARSLEGFRDAGLRRVSLGLAPLANVDSDDDSTSSRAVRAIYSNGRVNAAYHYQSLFFFKKKFNPQWRGGYLLYPDQLALPAVLAAVVRVHAPALSLRSFIAVLHERIVVKSVKFLQIIFHQSGQIEHITS